MTSACFQTGARRRQDGNILIIVVVLLLLASLFTLFALNVGRFEQKTSGNDLRAKIVQEVADAGISQGVEFLNANRGTLFATNANWRLCGAAEEDFPCGAVPAGRRDTMYAYVNTKPDAALADRQIDPLPFAFAQAGGFDVERQVGAVLCRISALPPSTPGNVECATDLINASTTWVVTVVSKATLPDEGSTATATQTIGAYNIFNTNTGIPPLVASGTVAVGGGFQVVAAPDASGDGGNPVSIWTRLDVDTNGTPNTCWWEDFKREGGTSAGPAYYDGIEVCHTCKCPTDASLSYGQGGLFCEGNDIVDIEADLAADFAGFAAGADANPVGCPVCTAANPERCPNLSTRREEFPTDLFAFLFGQNAWQDIDRDGVATGAPCTFAAQDCHFGEQRIISQCTYPDPATGAERTASLPADTCYLLNIKSKIHIGDGINDATECSALGEDTSGVVWVHKQPILESGSGTALGMPGFDCENTIRGIDQFGTPSAPVALVYDGVLTQVHFQFYGLLFVREPNASTTLTSATGGSAELGMNSGAVIYGAAVVQGMVTAGGGGSAAIVYNKDVLFNLINGPGSINPTSIPGSWTDRLRY